MNENFDLTSYDMANICARLEIQEASFPKDRLESVLRYLEDCKNGDNVVGLWQKQLETQKGKFEDFQDAVMTRGRSSVIDEKSGIGEEVAIQVCMANVLLEDLRDPI